ncbi:MAG: hypothetical protein MHMPM18_001857 [Marteilia pararefringens]
MLIQKLLLSGRIHINAPHFIVKNTTQYPYLVDLGDLIEDQIIERKLIVKLNLNKCQNIRASFIGLKVNNSSGDSREPKINILSVEKHRGSVDEVSIKLLLNSRNSGDNELSKNIDSQKFCRYLRIISEESDFESIVQIRYTLVRNQNIFRIERDNKAIDWISTHLNLGYVFTDSQYIYETKLFLNENLCTRFFDKKLKFVLNEEKECGNENFVINWNLEEHLMKDNEEKNENFGSKKTLHIKLKAIFGTNLLQHFESSEVSHLGDKINLLEINRSRKKDKIYNFELRLEAYNEFDDLINLFNLNLQFEYTNLQYKINLFAFNDQYVEYRFIKGEDRNDSIIAINFNYKLREDNSDKDKYCLRINMESLSETCSVKSEDMLSQRDNKNKRSKVIEKKKNKLEKYFKIDTDKLEENFISVNTASENFSTEDRCKDLILRFAPQISKCRKFEWDALSRLRLFDPEETVIKIYMRFSIS